MGVEDQFKKKIQNQFTIKKEFIVHIAISLEPKNKKKDLQQDKVKLIKQLLKILIILSLKSRISN